MTMGAAVGGDSDCPRPSTPCLRWRHLGETPCTRVIELIWWWGEQLGAAQCEQLPARSSIWFCFLLIQALALDYSHCIELTTACSHAAGPTTFYCSSHWAGLIGWHTSQGTIWKIWKKDTCQKEWQLKIWTPYNVMSMTVATLAPCVNNNLIL